MSNPPTPKETVLAIQKLRSEGWSVREIAREVHVGHDTVWRYTQGIALPRHRIRFGDGCWRIYERDAGWKKTSADPQYACLRWMRFASREVAERHLELYDWPAYGVAS